MAPQVYFVFDLKSQISKNNTRKDSVGSHKKLFSIKAQGANMVVWENACNWAGTPESKLEVRRLNRRNHDNSNILEKFIQFEYLDSLKQPEQNGEKISKTGSINVVANTMGVGWYAWPTWLDRPQALIPPLMIV